MVSGIPNHETLSVEMPSTVHFSGGIKESPEPIEECGCGPEEDEDDDAVCSCSKATKVLQCVVKACSSGSCNCNNRTLVDACEDLGSKCDNLKFKCSARKAECDSHEELEMPPKKKKAKKNATEPKMAEVKESDDNETLKKEEPSYDEVYEELSSLKEDKCKVLFAKDNGHEVDEKKLGKVKEEIDQKMEELEEACQKLPEMHCYKHFEEWTEPSKDCKDKDKAKAAGLTKSGAKSGAQRAPVAASVHAALVAAAGFAVAWS